jgi:hypothetical protein
MNTTYKLSVACLLLASLCMVQMKEVEMLFVNTVDHKFVTTKTRDYITAGY